MLLKLKTRAADSVPYLPFMLLRLTIWCAGDFTGHLFSLWQILQLSPLRKVWDGKNRCLLLIRACLCGWICPLDAGHHPSPSVPCIPWHMDMSQRHVGSPWGWEVLLICISGLQAQPGIFGEKRIISLTQMTFSLLCHKEENQALNLKSCWRSTRSPLAYL